MANTSEIVQPKPTLKDWANNGGLKKGSDINYGQLATGAVSLLGESMNNLQNNTNAQTAKAFNVNAGSFDELGSQFQGYKPLNFGWDHPFFEGLKGSLQSGATGAGAGSAAGPIGTLVGAIVGSVAGGLTGTFGALKRNKQGREAEERLNPLSINRFEGAASSLREDSITDSLINYAAMGGQISTQGGNFKIGLESFNTGGMHEQNPNGGIPQGIDPNGVPNTVEQGETKFQNYIFSNREMIDKDLYQGLGLPRRIVGKSFADASKVINKHRDERPNDAIANRTADAQLNTLRTLQEETKQIKEQASMVMNQAASGGQIHIDPSKKGTFTAAATKHGMGVQAFANRVLANKENYSPEMVKKANFAHNAAQWHAGGGDLFPFEESIEMEDVTQQQMLAPFLNRTSKPGFQFIPQVRHNIKPTIAPLSTENAIDRAIKQRMEAGAPGEESSFDWNQIGMAAPAISNGIQLLSALASRPDTVNIPRVSAGTRLNENFKYNPMDREYLANRLRAESGATRKGILNTAGGNRATAAAGLLMADKNMLGALGDAYFKADEVNQNKQMQIAQMINQARQVNAGIGMQEGQLNAQLGLQEYDINARNRAARANAIREGLSAISSNVSDVSKYYDNKETLENMFDYTTKGKYKKRK